MRPEFEEFIKNLKKKSSKGQNPAYEASRQLKFPDAYYQPFVLLAAKELGWDVLNASNEFVMLACEGKVSGRVCGIEVSVQKDEIKVHCQCDKPQLMSDGGDCHQKVELLLFALTTILEEMSQEQQQAAVAHYRKNVEWQGYEQPETLADTPSVASTNITSLAIAAIGSGVLLGGIAGAMSANGFYLIILFEYVVGAGLAFVLAMFLHKAGVTSAKQVVPAVVIGALCYAVVQNYTEYYFVLSDIEAEFGDASGYTFFEHLKLMVEYGLSIGKVGRDGFNLGSGAMYLFWIAQVVVPSWVAYSKLEDSVGEGNLAAIPEDVITYCVYMHDQSFTHDQMHKNLEQAGWKDELWRTRAIKLTENLTATTTAMDDFEAKATQTS